jgi:hypothetical protein
MDTIVVRGAYKDCPKYGTKCTIGIKLKCPSCRIIALSGIQLPIHSDILPNILPNTSAIYSSCLETNPNHLPLALNIYYR